MGDPRDPAIRVEASELEEFVAGVMARHGVPAEDARVTARVLVTADLQGIPSHGVARLGRYLAGIDEGFIAPGVEPELVEPAPTIAVMDARHGLGQVAAVRAMELAIDKARVGGLGLVTVKRSNHFGIAGYYARMALEQRMIGVAMTNSSPVVVPTFGTQVMLGSNPIAFAAPADGHPGFVLDAATSVVARGKLEDRDRDRAQAPAGWAIDRDGHDALDPGVFLRDLRDRVGGGLLPLGGHGERFSGHKGYGLALMVDVLCGVLSGAAFGPFVLERPRGDRAVPDVGHFFMAIDIQRFMPLDEFEGRMAEYIGLLRDGDRAEGQERIWIHGEKEVETAERNARLGIPLHPDVVHTLEGHAAECGHPFPVTWRCDDR